MNTQIRRVAFTLLILFMALFLRLDWIQLVKAEKLANDSRNRRFTLRDYSIERGAIVSADGVTLAESRPTPTEDIKYLRVYPQGPLFAQVTGYYSIQYGRFGFEQAHNKELAGRGGVLTMQELGDRLLNRSENGDTLVLSIDSRIQKAANDALAATGRRGAVVALDPITGQVLALVSAPSFDPNPLSQHSFSVQDRARASLLKDPGQPLLNRATRQTYPPGSTFKLITSAAAIEGGVPISTSFPATTSYSPAQTSSVIHNFGGSSCGGDMAQALKVSCNVYFARLGAELPQGALARAARAFGFEEAPPFDLTVAASRLPTAAQLKSPAFAAQSAIGQFDVSATPLQMALVASAIANSGKVPTPRLVNEVRDSVHLNVKRQGETEMWRTAITTQTAAQLRDMMIEVVRGGTGRAAALPGKTVAGKTGTAESGGASDISYAWFVGFAPAEAPRIALAVLVEGVGGGNSETGGRLAAPIARAIFEAHQRAAGW